MYTYVHIHLHVTHVHIHSYAYIHVHTYTYIHIRTHTYTYIHIHTHTYTYVHIHTHTYTYLHTYMYIEIGIEFGSDDVVIKFRKADNDENQDEVLPTYLSIRLTENPFYAVVDYIMVKAGRYDMSVEVKGRKVTGYPTQIQYTQTTNTTTGKSNIYS